MQSTPSRSARRTAPKDLTPPQGAAAATPSLNEPLLNAQQAADLLNVRISWIREATRTGVLPCLKVGRHVRYTRRMLEAWLGGRTDGLTSQAVR